MIFLGTDTECAEVIAQLDASLGYPRGYTQADVDSGLVRFYGPGPHPPLASLRTETISAPVPAAVDDDGQPIGAERSAKLPSHLLRAEHRETVARARVLRLLNRATREQLIAAPGIGAARADAILARRESGRMSSVDDARLPAQALLALVAAKGGDDDDAREVAESIRAAREVAESIRAARAAAKAKAR